MQSLPIFVRARGLPVILVGEGEAGEAKRRLLERAGAVIVDEAADAKLAFVAIEEPDAIAVRLHARGLLLNVADRPDLCDFTLPAIVDRDPVMIAIGTGGASAGLAAALRQRLEALLPHGLGRLARALFDARSALRSYYPDAGDRRRALAVMLAPGGALDPLIAHADPKIAPEDHEAPAASLERILLTSPDPDELTLRAARLLALADRIYHPADAPAAILDRARADAARIMGSAPAVPPPGLSVELIVIP
ncbi:NAD(P)-dependent oxidoreductase [Sphingomonas sp.]|uniref:precorrin-2 dehydrogenase/sirohydrochlorin ferrochelatase family protein n=1 Tax=Sphingomonas sp. TaxID=28214 RepID=UPI000DB018C8|nr:NAD(P)-dependent oxidoreductase [Sphingomonas sp.]PZU07013.1 MAG: siroheme synthase [Sphingomonas sp.]